MFNFNGILIKIINRKDIYNDKGNNTKKYRFTTAQPSTDVGVAKREEEPGNRYGH